MFEIDDKNYYSFEEADQRESERPDNDQVNVVATQTKRRFQPWAEIGETLECNGF